MGRAQGLTLRVLPPDEWYRLDETLSAQAWRHLDPARTEMIVVEDGNRIVGHVAHFLHPHLEGAWIDPAYRGKVAVGRRLLRAVRALVGGREVAAMAVSEDGRRLITGLGPSVHLDCDHYAVVVEG